MTIGQYLQIASYVVGLSIVILLMWLSDRAEAEEERKMVEELKKFPPDVQVQLYASYIRNKAERDLF